MKIAQIAPIAERVPPQKYGGTERIVHQLSEGLVKKGHQVTLFATGDSITHAQLKSIYPQGLREAKVKDPHGINPWTLLHLGWAYSFQEDFDIIHDHNNPISLPMANNAKRPVVMTIHSPLDETNQKLLSTLKNPNFVSISYSQIANATNVNFVDTVHNGLDLADREFSSSPDGYLLFIGRMSPEKGPHLAIEVAERIGLPLVMAAKVDEVDKDYFSQYIAPKLSQKITWIGEVTDEEKGQLYSKALAFLHPVTWPEPFGLTMIEAMASGCPVIGFNKGSVAELVIDKMTGFVVDNIEEMVESVRQIDKIDRHETRKYALTHFGSSLMVDRYEAIYQQVLSRTNKQTTAKLQNEWELLLESGPHHRKKLGNGSRDFGFRER